MQYIHESPMYISLLLYICIYIDVVTLIYMGK